VASAAAAAAEERTGERRKSKEGRSGDREK